MFEFLLFIICHIKGPRSLEWALEQDCIFSMHRRSWEIFFLPDIVHSNWVREHSAANNSDSPAAVVVSTIKPEASEDIGSEQQSLSLDAWD